MMPREADFVAKQESNAAADGNGDTTKASTSWSRFKDPRIVRVSKAFGGKDRHSKVCTVRGLRDRRVRLSVLTAIQLYDLQERLGLNQPSKVVDWLLDAAKHEIDELPPLQIPQGAFSHDFIASQSDKQGLKISADFRWNDPGKSKEVLEASAGDRDDADHQTWRNHHQQREVDNQNDYVSTSDFLSRQDNNNPYSFPSSYNSSNLRLSHPPISLGLTAQHEDLHNFNLVQLPSPSPSPATVPTHSGSHQFLVYQPEITSQSYQISPTNAAFDLKHPYFPPARPFQFSMTADLLPSQSNGIDEHNKRDELHSS